MDNSNRQQLVNELLGSAHLFVSAVSGVMEQRLLSEIAGKQLTLSQLKILKLLDMTESHHVGDVAAFLGVSDAAASKAVDRLVRRRYLRRTEARADRRSSELSLAAAGRNILKRYEAAKDRKLATMFAALDLGELQQTSAFLERLTKGIVHGSANPEEICLQCGLYMKKRCLVREASQAECQYQRRKTKQLVKNDGPQTKTSTRGGAGLGPPG
ncbi:MAG TPA: MarR family winged helix-turn-helix transcriptional regulator [Candidatus Acidoferrales bacterium]|nr:MarR family winged helix-turn-helix transcriptional regulator [Candidatus Acidoferrales bacterium]